ncbi:COG4784 Putative Zn-dependent protease [Rhabdaerophilaceae bacterium]
MLGLAGLLPLIAACVSETITIPPAEPRRVELPGSSDTLEPGSALEREHKRLIASFGGEYRAPRLHGLLSQITERLRLVSDRPNETYRITLLNSPTVNAFALPNGYVYLTRGLVALANDTAEIASVVAHEVAHVTGRHALERAELESRSVLVSRVQAEVLDNAGASRLMRDQSRVALASFSRQQEIDADEIGVRAIARAGFEAHGAARFLVALDRSSKMRSRLDGGASSEKTDILATHPTTPERLEKVISVARQYGAPGIGEANRAQWLQAVNGVAFGEDANQGVIRGSSFQHPRLRFAFKAPDGFVLENSPHAVLGVSPGGKEALRLDSSRNPIETPLRSLLALAPVEGIPVTDLTDLAIGSLPAATGLARGPDWTFRVVLIRMGDVVYRFIFAAQSFAPEADTRFLAVANSFRRLSDDEAKDIRSQRIALVTARSGEKPEDIVVAHMSATADALERFYVLNGLGPEDILVPGQTYKIVTGN